jgi:hypothetical protein
MLRKFGAGVLLLFLICSALGWAQDIDIESAVYNKVHKMKKLLNLTETQIDAISPIVKEYLTKRQAVLDEEQSSLVNHESIKGALLALKEAEYKKLSAFLTQDQMQKWINRDNLMATLNPDDGQSVSDDDDSGPTLTQDGAGTSMKF